MLEGDAGLAGPVIQDYVAQPDVDEVFGDVAEPLALEDGSEEEGDGPLDVAVLVEQEREKEEMDRAVMAWWHESQKAFALEDPGDRRVLRCLAIPPRVAAYFFFSN